LLYEQGEVDAAKDAYQQAIDSHHPDVAPKAALYLGLILQEQGEVDAAKDAYRQAIDSHDPEASAAATVRLRTLGS
jgi:DnaJ-domain-containing protein 1